MTKGLIRIRAFLCPACFVLGRCSERSANKHRSAGCNEGLPRQASPWECCLPRYEVVWSGRIEPWAGEIGSPLLFCPPCCVSVGPQGKSFNLCAWWASLANWAPSLFLPPQREYCLEDPCTMLRLSIGSVSKVLWEYKTSFSSLPRRGRRPWRSSQPV